MRLTPNVPHSRNTKPRQYGAYDFSLCNTLGHDSDVLIQLLVAEVAYVRKDLTPHIWINPAALWLVQERHQAKNGFNNVTIGLVIPRVNDLVVRVSSRVKVVRKHLQRGAATPVAQIPSLDKAVMGQRLAETLQVAIGCKHGDQAHLLL